MITLDRKQLRDYLYRMVVVSRETSLDAPILGKTIDSNLVLWYDSFELSIWSMLSDIQGDLDTFSIPLDKFFKIVDSWNSEQIKLKTMEDSSLRLISGRSRVTIPFYEGYTDDVILPPEGESLGVLPQEITSSFLDVLPFLSKVEDMSGVLSCMMLKGKDGEVEVTGCDTFHAYTRRAVSDNQTYFEALIPRKTVEVLSKTILKGVKVSLYKLDNDYLLLETDGGYSIQIAPFNGEYPNLVPIFNTPHSGYFVFNYIDMLEALNIVNTVYKGGVMQIDSRDNDIHVSPMEELYQSDIDLYLDGEIISEDDYTIKVNTGFFKHCMDIFAGEKGILFSANDSGMIHIIGKDKDVSVILMAVANAPS